MADTYKGDSPGKKIARAIYWEHVKMCMGPAFKSGIHVVLGGREGGDIGVLRSHGVAWDAIVAVEREPEAFAALRARWPLARAEFGDIADVCIRLSKKERIASVLLDFCSQICDETMRITTRVVQRSLKDGATLGFGILRGREQKNFKMKSIQERQEWMASRWKREPKLRAQLPNPDFAMEAAALDGDRSFAMVSDLNERGAPMRWIASPLIRVDYHSRTSSSRGVPMTIAGSEIIREPMYTSLRSFEKRVHAQHGNNFDRIFFGSIKAGGVDEVRRFALQSLQTDRDVDRVSLALNVPRSTIIAWKAHETRGTCSRDEAAE